MLSGLLRDHSAVCHVSEYISVSIVQASHEKKNLSEYKNISRSWEINIDNFKNIFWKDMFEVVKLENCKICRQHFVLNL